MRLLLSTLAKILFLLFILGIDAGFLPGLGGNWNLLNISFIVSIFFAFVFRNALAYLFYFSSTTLIAFTAGSLYFIPLIAGLMSLFVITLLLERFFTNRSYYVLLVLGAIAWGLYHLIYSICIFIYTAIVPDAIVQPITFEWLGEIAFHTLLVLVILSIGYLGMNFMSKRFKSYFIISDY